MMLEIINIIAIVVSPIIAVFVGQLLQSNKEKRNDKLRIFETLMAARTYGWTKESVDALNILDIVFSNDKDVNDNCKKEKN